MYCTYVQYVRTSSFFFSDIIECYVVYVQYIRTLCLYVCAEHCCVVYVRYICSVRHIFNLLCAIVCISV